MKKNLKNPEDKKPREITRVGVYGVVMEEGKMLLIRQNKGPYKGMLDFPGGGIEFGESPELALRREFVEEVAMEFDSMQLIDNLTTTINVPSLASIQAYTLFQVGMIYQVNGCQYTESQVKQEFEPIWIDPKGISEDQCSNLLWKYLQTQFLK